MRWYVVHTRPQAERQAIEQLRRQGFDAYLPCYRKLRRHARRREMVRAPLFPRYLFVAIDLDVQRWRSINGTLGVSHLICQGDRPAPVPEGVVERLCEREDGGGMVSLADIALFNRGARLLVLDGTFIGKTGVYDRITAEERVVLLLEILGREVEVSIPIHAVEAA